MMVISNQPILKSWSCIKLTPICLCLFFLFLKVLFFRKWCFASLFSFIGKVKLWALPNWFCYYFHVKTASKDQSAGVNNLEIWNLQAGRLVAGFSQKKKDTWLVLQNLVFLAFWRSFFYFSFASNFTDFNSLCR